MFKSQNFCHIASNNRNNVKAGMFIYRTTDDLATVTANGYFNDRIIDLNLHDIIVHEQIDNADPTKVKQNFLCVVQKTLTNVNTKIMDTDEVDGANTDLDNLSDTGKANISAEGTYDPNKTYDAGTVGAAIQSKADAATSANTDLSNLTSTGANIANWSSNVTNCLTEIPQDINLTLSNGTLTLKAGSKIYHPDGENNFNTYTTSSDISSIGYGTGTRQMMVFVRYNGTGMDTTGLNFVYSGSGSFSGNGIYYNTTTNNIDYYTIGSPAGRDYCFPIAIITMTDATITSIDQVFNGFGFIGSTVFALPGVKGLIPDGRNTDGTLKNTTFALSSVKTQTSTLTVSNTTARIYAGGAMLWSADSDIYNPDTNYNMSGTTTDNACVFAHITSTTGGQITSFNPKTVFHAVDYNDTDFIANCAMPSKRYTDLTLPAAGGTVTAPTDGYLAFAKSAQTTEYIGLVNQTNGIGITSLPSSNDYIVRVFLPVSKGNVVTVLYNASGSTSYFRFIYANGAK